jgi:hypothetical protein
VEAIYEAFGRGDLEATLERLTDDVDWASEAESDIAPWHGVRRGKDQSGGPLGRKRAPNRGSSPG